MGKEGQIAISVVWRKTRQLLEGVFYCAAIVEPTGIGEMESVPGVQRRELDVVLASLPEKFE